MSESDEVRLTMVKSAKLWRSGDLRRALKLLDGSIAEAVRQGRRDWAQALSRHAAVMCRLDGDLRSARRYNEQALSYGPDSPMTIYGLAEVLLEQGEAELAREYAKKCYELSVRGGTELDRARIELIVRRWPELDTRQP
jgi:tetratricopeptide (TPR) repeat protein